VRGKGSDQGTRWPVGIWFALVGVSAGTVASFAMVGWTFTRGLYTGGDAVEPVEIESGTVVIEGEEPALTPGEIEGIAGGDPVPDGLAEPGAGIDPEPAEPRAEPLSGGDPEDDPGPPVEEAGESGGGGQSEPPRLVPVGEGDPCSPEESAEDPDPDWSGDWDPDRWGPGAWEPGEWDLDEWSPDHWDQWDDLGADHRLELELELQALEAMRLELRD
jgi:hypothetical protein